MNIALKINVSTYRGTRDGVPALVELLQQHGAGATFLFSLGPDHTGRAVRRLFRPGFLRRIRRTAAISRYGFPTLVYGTLLPGPDIGRRCADVMRGVREAGFETGILAWDPTRWHDHVAGADEAWTRAEMERARERYREIFGEDARVHGAAGWQMNRHAYRLTQSLGFDYCSDTRGTSPFVPAVDHLPFKTPIIGAIQSILLALDQGINNIGFACRDVEADASEVTFRKAVFAGAPRPGLAAIERDVQARSGAT